MVTFAWVKEHNAKIASTQNTMAFDWTKRKKRYALGRLEGRYRRRRKLLMKKLREARLQAGLTQGYASKKLGQPQSFISRIESGQRLVEFAELLELANVYGQPLSFFEPPPPDEETYDE